MSKRPALSKISIQGSHTQVSTNFVEPSWLQVKSPNNLGIHGIYYIQLNIFSGSRLFHSFPKVVHCYLTMPTTDNAPSSEKFRRQGFFHYWELFHYSERSELDTKNFKAKLYFLLLVIMKSTITVNDDYYLNQIII